jgi:hypothetical protein
MNNRETDSDEDDSDDEDESMQDEEEEDEDIIERAYRQRYQQSIANAV